MLDNMRKVAKKLRNRPVQRLSKDFVREPTWKEIVERHPILDYKPTTTKSPRDEAYSAIQEQLTTIQQANEAISKQLSTIRFNETAILLLVMEILEGKMTQKSRKKILDKLKKLS
jgi:hypothetical protein